MLLKPKLLESHLYKAITDDVQVAVEPEYQPHRSSPDQGKHVWAYHIEISNLGQRDIQLRGRYWRIVDGNGRIQEVRGRGVVGEEPMIAAGDSYRYSSGCPLDSESGFMSGYFEMESENGTYFEVIVPTFSLDIPNQTVLLN